MDVKFKTFLISTILNILDLLTSCIDFNLGFIETNKWMLLTHNSYLSALMSVVVFELILVAWYAFSKIYDNVKYGMLVFGLTKLYPIINNIYLLIISFLV